MAINSEGFSKLIIILILGFIALIIGGVIFIIIGSKSTQIPKNIDLTVWGVWDDTSDLENIINSYQKNHPYISIKYSKIRYEEYEDLLLKAWATDTGPDIYAIPNSWVTKYSADFITPLPKSTEVAYYTTKKVLFQTETKIEYRKENSLTASDIKRNFVDVVYDDIIIDGKIYAMPLGINTLVMFYNRELLDQAHVVQPPQTWNEFTNLVPRITIVDEQNDIVRAGAALGTYDNISQASDIVTLLMLQYGATMVSGDKITFSHASAADPTFFPGIEALHFYTAFALPEKTVYTWNDQMPDALDFFASGQLAFFFGYQYQEPDILAKSRGIDYEIASMPQINPENEINYANYWVYTVANKTSHSNEGWNFLQYAANENRVSNYLTASHQTSVLRSILNEQLKDPEQSVHAQQAITAQSWYHGKKPQAAENHFLEMIASVVDDSNSISSAITTAASKIQEEY